MSVSRLAPKPPVASPMAPTANGPENPPISPAVKNRPLATPMLRPSTPGTLMSVRRQSPARPNRRKPTRTRRGVTAKPDTSASIPMVAPRQSESTTGAASGRRVPSRGSVSEPAAPAAKDAAVR